MCLLPRLFLSAAIGLMDAAVADEPQDPVVAQSAFMLYGMIHARFIVTARGLEAMVSWIQLLS